MEVHFKSEKQDWGTPELFFHRMSKAFGPFDMDVCASHTNAKCTNYFTPELQENGLEIPWLENNGHTCWMNPPYGRGIGAWVKKAYEESLKGARVCALLPARTDTKWFQEWVLGKAQLVWVKGRLKFEGAPHSAPFPSVIALYGYKETAPAWVQA